MKSFERIGEQTKGKQIEVENGVMRLDENGDEEHNNKPHFFTYSLTYDTNCHLR